MDAERGLIKTDTLGFTPIQHAWLFLLYEVAGVVTNRAGEAIRFNAEVPRSDGVLVAAPGVHRDLVAQLR